MTNSQTTYWFFIRGLMREAAHWENFPKVFEQAFTNVKVITLDLPGSGVHWRDRAPLSVAETAEFLRQQAQAHLEKISQITGKRPDSYVLAISLGGMVALEWLQNFSEDLRGGVFINISLAGVNPFYKRLKPKAWAPLLSIVFTQDVKRREKKVLELTASQHPIEESQLVNRVSAYERHPSSKLNFLRQIVAASKFRPHVKKVKTPILLLSSRGDRLVDSSCSEAISHRWNWKLKVHPTANHDLPLEDPEWVISQIKDWLPLT